VAIFQHSQLTVVFSSSQEFPTVFNQSVGRLPQEVLLEEFYRSECSESVRVGRVRVFEELPTVFNCSVLTFGVQ
jgi:hypothetical protein